jgi:hypothetical protein
MDNLLIESFNGHPRDEHLNEDRPHASLENIPPRDLQAVGHERSRQRVPCNWNHERSLSR